MTIIVFSVGASQKPSERDGQADNAGLCIMHYNTFNIQKKKFDKTPALYEQETKRQNRCWDVEMDELL